MCPTCSEVWFNRIVMVLVSAFSGLGFGFFARDVVAAPQPTVQQSFRVLLDPGHGGDNLGCRSADRALLEKEVTLILAKQLSARLIKRLPHIEVMLSREGDESMTLAERVALANEVGADLLLSIHANASLKRNQTGFESYVLDYSSQSLMAARLAQSANDESALQLRSQDLASTMVRHLQIQAHQRLSLRFAQMLQEEQLRQFPERLNRGVRQANFDVLVGARMPAVLHEVGFLDHPDEDQLFVDPRLQKQLVEAMADAINQYYRLVVFSR